jgi:hypothetical protein
VQPKILDYLNAEIDGKFLVTNTLTPATRQAGSVRAEAAARAPPRKTRRVVMFGLLLCEERVMPV